MIFLYMVSVFIQKKKKHTHLIELIYRFSETRDNYRTVGFCEIVTNRATIAAGQGGGGRIDVEECNNKLYIINAFFKLKRMFLLRTKFFEIYVNLI